MPNFVFFLIACVFAVAAFELRKFKWLKILSCASVIFVAVTVATGFKLVPDNKVRVIAVSGEPYRLAEGLDWTMYGRPYEEFDISGDAIKYHFSYGRNNIFPFLVDYEVVMAEIEADVKYRLDIDNEKFDRYMDREDKVFAMFSAASKYSGEDIPFEERIWETTISQKFGRAMRACLFSAVYYNLSLESLPHTLDKPQSDLIESCVLSYLESYEPLAIFSEVSAISIKEQKR